MLLSHIPFFLPFPFLRTFPHLGKCDKSDNMHGQRRNEQGKSNTQEKHAHRTHRAENARNPGEGEHPEREVLHTVPGYLKLLLLHLFSSFSLKSSTPDHCVQSASPPLSRGIGASSS